MTRAWMAWVTRLRLAHIAVALALGSAGASFADRLSDVVIQMLAQHIGRNPFGGESGSEVGLADVVSAPYFLNFRIGGTLIVYGETLSAALSLALLCIAGLLVLRRAGKVFTACRFCAARIPRLAMRCAICGSSLEPAE